ncbi:MAG: 5-oxoprolinase/urea amidolyase family protein [Frankiales bacterium]|nr:5-oxoprolinase/urea amidolyase family protein [Frankiales bacterium]
MTVVAEQQPVNALVGIPRVDVLEPGAQTHVQDLPGRTGLWSVGVPPSGAWDDLSFSLANLAVGNAVGDAGLEAVVRGPVLRFMMRTLVCLTGAVFAATLDGRPVRAGRVLAIPAGGVLDVGPLDGPGMRAYVAIGGGLDVPRALGSRSTFLLGGFGGLDGRALRAGDVLAVLSDENSGAPFDVVDLLPVLSATWMLRVVPGPHGAPEHLTETGVEDLFAATWRIDHQSDRTGVRLVGPRPGFARQDGGEAGLHPSNVHDSAYPVGGLMLSGGTPVVVGPDGPSLGGFVVPAVVISADRWVLAQARPGDTVQLVPVTPSQADAAVRARDTALRDLRCASGLGAPVLGVAGLGLSGAGQTGPVGRPEPLLVVPAQGVRPELVVRRAGDCHLLVELGPPVLDLVVRLQVHLLARLLSERVGAGVLEAVEGVRSLLLKVDASRLPLARLAQSVGEAWAELPDLRDVELPVRDVVLPLSLDDPAAHEAMLRYSRNVRTDAPWLPDNVEFLRRVNGLDERQDVFDVVLSATYLVVGLGDVYLGAPVAVPLDPRHRLVSTKYDPARTWTPENAVGIGGVYLCVYGMEGPGGYQLVGRTVPVWRYHPSSDDQPSADPPWLLRTFDRLRFRPVSAAELLELREDVRSGRTGLDVRPGVLRLADLLPTDDVPTTAFLARRDAAFGAERARWAAQA